MSETTCFICGGAPHEPYALHTFWSEADAWREALSGRTGGPLPSMTTTETLDPREAAYTA